MASTIGSLRVSLGRRPAATARPASCKPPPGAARSSEKSSPRRTLNLANCAGRAAPDPHRHRLDGPYQLTGF